MDISLIGKIILYSDISIMGLICIILFYWQFNVLKGKAMDNPDGTFDDWHVQKLCYGIAVADIFIAIPMTLLGIILIFVDSQYGYHIVSMAAFWFLWINTATTVTSLKFEKPKISFKWIIIFPLGAVLGLIYLIWLYINFNNLGM